MSFERRIEERVVRSVSTLNVNSVRFTLLKLGFPLGINLTSLQRQSVDPESVLPRLLDFRWPSGERYL